VAVGDFNLDRNPDVATTTSSVDSDGFNSVSVLLGRGESTLAR